MTYNFFLKNQHYCLHSVTFSLNFYDLFAKFFTKIPTPPIPSLFSDHHTFYLLPLIQTNRASCILHLTSCRQHTSTFLFTVHTLLYLFHINFQHSNLNLTSNFCNPEILCTPCPFKSCGGLGAISSTNFFMR